MARGDHRVRSKAMSVVPEARGSSTVPEARK